MNKYKVTVESIIEAKERREAWNIARQIFETDLDYIGQVMSVTDKLPNPQNWYGINDKDNPNRALAILHQAYGR